MIFNFSRVKLLKQNTLEAPSIYSTNTDVQFVHGSFVNDEIERRRNTLPSLMYFISKVKYPEYLAEAIIIKAIIWSFI